MHIPAQNYKSELIPPDKQSTSSSDEDEIKEEESDRSCAFIIPTQSVLARKTYFCQAKAFWAFGVLSRLVSRHIFT